MPLLATQLAWFFPVLQSPEPVQQRFHIEPLSLDVLVVQTPDAPVWGAPNAREPVHSILVIRQYLVVLLAKVEQGSISNRVPFVGEQAHRMGGLRHSERRLDREEPEVGIVNIVGLVYR